MLDPNLLRNEPVAISKKLARRGFKLNLEMLLSLEQSRKVLQIKKENLQAERNLRSKFIGYAKERGENIDLLCQEINTINGCIDKIKIELETIQNKIQDFFLTLPNLPSDDVPFGEDKSDNQEVSRWGEPRKFSFPIRDHVDLGEITQGLNFSSAIKLTGARFVVMQGQIARLHRALSQFMLDLHTQQHGYIETYVPYLVNQTTLYSTGQLPKFGKDLFHVSSIGEDKKKYALIPTAEVPLTNLVRDTILEEESLPIKFTAYTPCFRSEAGSYGRDTRGMIRMHQFDKVELVQIVCPENSMQALEEIVSDAEQVLQKLNLPYRKMLLCTNDMSASSAKTYDLEVWLPTQNAYREISSCSNMLDFQSRRMKARFYRKSDKKLHLVHTLNGSGLAVGRTLVAVMENYQRENGCIEIPEVLQPYMNNLTIIN